MHIKLCGFCVELAILCALVSISNGQINTMRSSIPTYTPEDTEDMGKPLFLTPYIRSKSKDIHAGQQLAQVRHPKLEWLTSYSGFLTVNKKYNSNLFFWYCKAQKNSETAPLVVWLQGGPGTTSLYGMFYENGPFYLTPELDFPPREYSWHLDHNIIYIDNPVGAGFSFTDNEQGYSNTQTEVAKNLYEALQQFLDLFPELRNREVFLTGESFGGKYVPALGYYIYLMNADATDYKVINLKGMAIGNGFSDPINQIDVLGHYLHATGLIDRNTRVIFEDIQDDIKIDIEAGRNSDALTKLDNLMLHRNSLFANVTGFTQLYNYVVPQESIFQPFLTFLKDAEIRKAIHVGGLTFTGSEDNEALNHILGVFFESVVEWITELLTWYPIMFYTGQLDIEVPYIGTVNFIQKMEYHNQEEYMNAPRHIWRVDGEVAGYAKQAGFLTEVLVRNAGHMVPLDQPKWALDLITHLTYKKSFTSS
ncbi:hypothetical protein DMENIID0001_076180 [Sergentomyia squamirostris]